ncbi:hypothetical protein AAMO2058_000792000 [Amorphochlora amoebiformis]
MFEDAEQGVVFTSSQWAGSVMLRDCGIQTKVRRLREIATQTKRPSVDQGTQTKESVVSSNISNTIPVDNQPLHEFILKVGPLMDSELRKAAVSTAFEDYKVVWEEERDTIVKLQTLVDSSVQEQEQEAARKKSTSCSAVDFSCNGSMVACAFGDIDHYGWCDHNSKVSIWNIMSRRLNANKPHLRLPVSCCVGCLAFHPTKPSLLAAGLFTGEVRLWDITQQEDPLIASSLIDDYFHREPIVSVKWVGDGRGNYKLASASGDGRILFWDVSDKLKYPIRGASIRPTPQYHGHGERFNQYPIIGASSLAFSTLDFHHFIIGTEGGGVLKCENRFAPTRKQKHKDGKLVWTQHVHQFLQVLPTQSRYEVLSCLRKFASKTGTKLIDVAAFFAARPPPLHVYPHASKHSFEKHSGPVYAIATSPFHRNLFLTCSTDGTLRVYHMLKLPRAVVVMEPSNTYLFDVKWSPARPLVFAVADAAGFIHIYDLGVDRVAPVVSFQASSSNSNSKSASVNNPQDKKENSAVKILRESSRSGSPASGSRRAGRAGGNVGRRGSRPGMIVSISFSPRDGSMLAAADSNGGIAIWQLSTRLSSVQEGELNKLEALVETLGEDKEKARETAAKINAEEKSG